MNGVVNKYIQMKNSAISIYKNSYVQRILSHQLSMHTIRFIEWIEGKKTGIYTQVTLKKKEKDVIV